MKLSEINYDVKNKIATISINRPKKLNALSEDVFYELKKLLFVLKDNQRTYVRGLIIKGEGPKAFIAGADIQKMSLMSPKEGTSFGQLGQEINELIESLPFPVIACVDGFALGGGCELAMSCDYIYATKASYFGQPEVRLGLIPGFGGCVRLVRYIGLAKARDLIFSGRKVNAQEAQDMGLVHTVFTSPDDMILAAEKTLTEIFKNSPQAVTICKKVLNSLPGKTHEESLKIENDGFQAAFLHPEKDTGVSAFLEKKDPRFDLI